MSSAAHVINTRTGSMTTTHPATLPVEKNRLHKAYVNRPTTANKKTFYRSRRLVLTAAGDAGRLDDPHGRGEPKPFTISDAAIDLLPEAETNADIDFLASLQETIRAVQQLFSGKAPGFYAIPAEIYKHGGPQLMKQLSAFPSAEIAPTLFSLMFSAMLIDAYRDECPGICIAYRTDGHVFNSRCMQAPTGVSTTTVQDFLFVDNCALNTVTEGDMQRSMELFASDCTNCGLTIDSLTVVVRRCPPWHGLTINTAKTVVMHQPPPSAEYSTRRINVNGAQLEKVKTFAYLVSTLSRNTRIDDKVAQRISKVSQTFSRLQASVWNHPGIHLNTKLTETWTVYSNQDRKTKPWKWRSSPPNFARKPAKDNRSTCDTVLAKLVMMNVVQSISSLHSLCRAHNKQT
ncbi:unnamed protein product [Schistocephalus solidus]|uniref:Reverse transcriptase domain-containing protein n=1 Tax=Schistocephalus solidus TaxID=70667 RepID=A0A183SGS5_SCHSO|nr:unnamed protein product [Schistocephalus solidus]